jgi:hypothetical protein
LLHLAPLLLNSLLDTQTGLPSRGDAWTRVQTANFTVVGDAPAFKVKEVALELERLRAVLARMKKGGAASSPVPVAVYVFKSTDALAPYLPRRDGKPVPAAAYFQESEDGSYIALSAAWNSDPRPIVYHEYLHDFMRANFPPQPVWYEEGVAEFYSTFRTEGDEAQTGIIREDHLEELREGSIMLPLERLLAVKHDSPEYNEQDKQGAFYAESWALVHYLMRGNPERTSQLGRYLVLLQSGTPDPKAFRDAFGMEPWALFSELVAYVRNKRFFFNRIKLSDLQIPQEARVETLPWEEAVFRLGDLLAHGDESRLDDAERFFDSVLAARPAHAGALGGLARVRLRQDRLADAAPLLRRAAETGSADFRVHYYDGELRMRELSARPAEKALDAEARLSLEAARSAFRRSVALNPDFAEARVALGRTYLVEEGAAPDEAVAALEEAHRRLPTREDVVMDLVQLYESRGEREKADRLAAGTIGPAASLALARRRQPNVIDATVGEVNRLLGEGRDEEALAVLDRFIAQTQQEEVRSEMQAQRDALERGIAKNRAAAAYNGAVELYNRRDYAAALPAFEKLAAESKDADVANKARAMAEEIRSRMKTKK